MASPEMIPVAEAAKRLGTQAVTVRQMCRERTFPFMRAVGSSFFIVRAGFERHMAGETPAPIDTRPAPLLHRIEPKNRLL